MSPPQQLRQQTSNCSSADGLPTKVVTHQLQVERRTAKGHRPKTDALPLDYTTNVYLHKRPFPAVITKNYASAAVARLVFSTGQSKPQI